MVYGGAVDCDAFGINGMRRGIAWVEKVGKALLIYA